MLPVFGRTAHHGWATNVDVFNRVIQCAIGHGHRGFKWVEVDHQHVDGVDAMGFQRLHVRWHVATRQQTTMHIRMQRFDATIEHFGNACDLCHFAHRQTLRTEQLRGTSGGNQLHAQIVQGTGKFNNACFVRHRDQCVHGDYFLKIGPGRTHAFKAICGR